MDHIIVDCAERITGTEKRTAHTTKETAQLDGLVTAIEHVV